MNFLFIFISILSWDFSKADIYTKKQELRKKLLVEKKYDKMTLPNHRDDENGTTFVYTYLVLQSLDLDDQTQMFTVTSVLAMMWTDPRLTWSYEDYSQIHTLYFAYDELWHPDIRVFNSAEDVNIDHFGKVRYTGIFTGSVGWYPPAHFKVYCNMDFKYWPFDKHTCEVILTAWTTHGMQVYFEVALNKSKIATNKLVSELNGWTIVSATERSEMRYDIYQTMHLEFELKRYSPTFSAVVVVPCIVIPILLLLQFLLPVESSKRMLISSLCLLIVFLEMLFLKYRLPKLGTNTPLIIIYFAQCLVLSTLMIALNNFLERLTHPQNPLLAFSPPEIVKRVLTSRLSVILCLQFHASKVGLSGMGSEDGQVLEGNAAPNYGHEWLLVAKAVDRVAFISLITIFIISMFAYVAPLH